jgi:hypothetical protein
LNKGRANSNDFGIIGKKEFILESKANFGNFTMLPPAPSRDIPFVDEDSDSVISISKIKQDLDLTNSLVDQEEEKCKSKDTSVFHHKV